jgi:tyrosinase
MANLFIRKDVWDLDPDDPIIKGYADAVAAMKTLPASNSLSWSYQAAIHGTVQTPNQTLWNQCQHQSWYFAPWHRMFLFFFEEVVRTHVVSSGGPADWALPYWDYTDSGHNSLPLAFRAATDASDSPNPLYTAQRGSGINAGLGLSAQAISTTVALNCQSFTGTSEFAGGIAGPAQFAGATGQLESTPHNSVHGQMGGLMGVVQQAAQDPIFWLHHANIDRLWWKWNKAHGSPTDAAWLNESFSFFDASGTQTSRQPKDVIDTENQLGYTYDDAAPVPAVSPPKAALAVKWPPPWPESQAAPAPVSSGPGPILHLIGISSEPAHLIGERVDVTVPVDESSLASLLDSPVAGELQRRAFIDLDDIDVQQNPDLVYGVYLNLPPDPTDADVSEDHIGNLSLFGAERAQQPTRDEHAHGYHVTLEITGVLDRLVSAGQWNDPHALEVSFRPLTLEVPADRPELVSELPSPAHPENPVTIGQIALKIA